MSSIKVAVYAAPGVDVDVKVEAKGHAERHRRRRRRRNRDEHPAPAHPEARRLEYRPPEPAPMPTAAARAATGITFRQAAEAYIAAHRGDWKNAKHAEQWEATLSRFVYPLIGERPVAQIDIGAVLEVLEAPVDGDTSFWRARNETARRVRGRIENVLDWARVRKLRDETENPARWRGNLDKALPTKAPKTKHHAALPYAEIAPFMANLRTRNGVSARALEFGILCASRTGEVLGARWGEIDLDARTWIIPGERMKAGSEHRVPLTDRAVEILNAMGGAGDGLVFPGPGRRQLSNMALLSVLKRMQRDDITVHGFRSTFRDWAAEETTYQNEVVEMALAHTIGNKVEAAYRRGDLFEKRRRLMEDWAAACGVSAQPEPQMTDEAALKAAA